MSSAYDASGFAIKLGRYAVGPDSTLTDPLLIGRVRDYRRRVGGRMDALDRGDLRRRVPKGKYHVSRKIDGEFTVLVFDGEEAFTINPGGTVRIHLPFAAEAAACLKKAGWKSALIAGELYVRRSDDKRPRVHDVVSVARQPSSEEDLGQLGFAVFDIMDKDGEVWEEDYAVTWKTIQEIFPDTGAVHQVETKVDQSREDIDKWFGQWVEGEGAEGVVARSDAGGSYKIKPRHTVDLVVVGFAEGINDRAGLLHDLLLAVVRPDGFFHLAGRVGGGFSDEERRGFLSDFADIAVDSSFTEVNRDRIAYQMVKPIKVCEISCLDLIATTTRGGSINQMVIRWDENESCWHPERRLPLVSIISPEFIRLRDDKEAGPEDTGVSQLTRLVEIEDIDKTLDDFESPRSEVLRRVVHTKVLKGRTMVRKLMLWKTNKDQCSQDFPAYVLYLTDFSPNRKTPMNREMRVSDSLKQMEDYWETFAKKYFVGGWKEVGAEEEAEPMPKAKKKAAKKKAAPEK